MAVAVNKSLIDSKKPAIGEEKSAIDDKKSAVDRIKSAIERQKYNEPSKANILKVYDEIEKNQIFGTKEIKEIKEILDCSPSTARAVMTKLRDAKSKKGSDIPIAPSLYSLSNKTDNSLLAVRDINHKYIVVERNTFMSKELQIRNSTVDFLVFTRDAGEDGIEVRVQNGDVWLTQKAISQLFDVDRSVITKHLSNIFKEGELDENSVCAKFAQTADDGKTYNYKFYSLAAIIAVGYRINSERATQFRTWATKVLDTFTKQGYVLDKSRLINGQIFDEDYFEHLIAEIQEIRASERRFYQKITDIYATAVDYDKNSQVTREFYATVQNKMHYAVHGNTAAEVIVARADHNKEHMGLKSWKNAPDGKIVKTDVSIAKNYLEKEELAELNEIVTMYLDYATRQARRHIPMTMEDWKTKLDAFLRFNDADVLQDKGKVTAAIAKEFAESEFEKYRVIQDSLYESDFDKLMNDMEKNDAIH